MMRDGADVDSVVRIHSAHVNGHTASALLADANFCEQTQITALVSLPARLQATMIIIESARMLSMALIESGPQKAKAQEVGSKPNSMGPKS